MDINDKNQFPCTRICGMMITDWILKWNPVSSCADLKQCRVNI